MHRSTLGLGRNKTPITDCKTSYVWPQGSDVRELSIDHGLKVLSRCRIREELAVANIKYGEVRSRGLHWPKNMVHQGNDQVCLGFS